MHVVAARRAAPDDVDISVGGAGGRGLGRLEGAAADGAIVVDGLAVVGGRVGGG